MSDDFQGRGGSPWGTPPGGGNGSGKGPTPPDIDALIRDIQSKINRFLPGGSSSGGKPIGLILIILAFVWLASGLYRVLPDEQGVVLRFGKFVKTTQPGLNYHIPFPVETVETPKVTKVNRIDIGFRSERDSGFSSGGGVADVPQESLMLTGDENIVNIDFSVFWVIKDAGKFLFEIQDPEGTVKAAAETAMREVIAKSDIQPILTEGRAKIEIETQEIIQSILDEYNSGIQITQVQTQKADPPDQVIMLLEMFKLLEQIWKDQKMKLRRMPMTLFQEQEEKLLKLCKRQRHTNKKLLQLQKVRLADLYQFIMSTLKQKKLLKRECT